MALRTIGNVGLVAMSAAVPEYFYDMSAYPYFDPDEFLKFRNLVGIERKGQVKPGQTAGDLCRLAAEQILNSGLVSASEIDALVFVSQTRDYIFPPTSSVLQYRLGLPQSCLAFDLSMGCSGFTYGLTVLASLMESGQIRNALLLCGDTCSLTTTENDPVVFPLMGDAGTALLLRYDRTAGNMVSSMHTDGSGYADLIIPGGGYRQKCTPENTVYQTDDDGIQRRSHDVRMNGDKILTFSLRTAATDIRAVASETGLSLDQVDFFMLHQANKLINESIRKQLKQPLEKFPSCLKHYGNTGAASIPLTFVTQLGEQTRKSPLNFICSGFGVGLSWCTVSFQTSGLICLPVSTLSA